MGGYISYPPHISTKKGKIEIQEFQDFKLREKYDRSDCFSFELRRKYDRADCFPFN